MLDIKKLIDEINEREQARADERFTSFAILFSLASLCIVLIIAAVADLV